jgi:hypothetical protein
MKRDAKPKRWRRADDGFSTAAIVKVVVLMVELMTGMRTTHESI